MKLKLNRLTVPLLLMALLLNLNSVLAANLPKLVVPVFFVTDRALNLNDNNLGYGLVQVQDEPGLSKIACGVKNIVLEGADTSGITAERMSGLGWWNILPGANSADLTPVIKNTTKSQQDLLAQISAIVNEGPADRPLVLFVNGCCQSFDDSTKTAANISKELGAPVLVFAWAAIPPTLQKYRENEFRQEQSKRRFVSFLSELEKLVPPERIILIAHSMGNRLLFEALRTRYFNYGKNTSHPKYAFAMFACADLNTNNFIAEKKGIAFNSKLTWVTKNNTDPALIGSEIQRIFYERRLGAPITSMNKYLDVPGLQVLDIESLYRLKHDLPIPLFPTLFQSGATGHFKLQKAKQPNLFIISKQ